MARRFHCQKLCYSNTTAKHLKMPMAPTDPIMDEFVIAMSLFAVVSAPRKGGSGYGPMKSVEFTMMLWPMQTGSVLISHLTSMFLLVLNQN